jgi:uncharacterized protein (DUF1697 family)
MPKFLALLRGINVSGQKLIKMQDLNQLFLDNGFKNCETYIQSGNVIFDSKITSEEKISEQIKKIIQKKYKFDVENKVLNPKDISKIIQSNPYLKKKDFNEKAMYVSFLSAIPEKENVKALSAVKSADDSFEWNENVLYLYCPGGYGKTKLSNNVVENKLKLVATTRNWNTVLKLQEMLLD